MHFRAAHFPTTDFKVNSAFESVPFPLFEGSSDCAEGCAE